MQSVEVVETYELNVIKQSVHLDDEEEEEEEDTRKMEINPAPMPSNKEECKIESCRAQLEHNAPSARVIVV